MVLRIVEALMAWAAWFFGTMLLGLVVLIVLGIAVLDLSHDARLVLHTILLLGAFALGVARAIPYLKGDR